MAGLSFSNHDRYLRDFLLKCYNNSQGNQFTLALLFPLLAKLLIAISNTLNNHQETIEKISSIIVKKEEVSAVVAKHGGRGIEAMNKRYKEYDYMKKQSYVERDEWIKLSAFEKINKSFHFMDYNQFPKVALWKNLSLDEKEKVLEKHIEWRNKRMSELIKAYNEKQSKSIKNIDTFMWYNTNKLDCKGFEIRMSTKENIILKIEGDYEEIYQELERIWKEEGEKKHIYNRVFVKGKTRRTFGKRSTYSNLGYRTTERRIEPTEGSDQPIVYQLVTPVKPKNYFYKRGVYGNKIRGRPPFRKDGQAFIGKKRRDENNNNTMALKEESEEKNKSKKN